MKLMDGLHWAKGVKYANCRVEIPDCSREDLPQFFVEMGYKVGVEIGVEEGYFSESLLKAGLQVYSVDPWVHSPNWRYQRAQVEMDKILARATARLGQYPNSTIVRKISMDAVKDFEDGSLDFVYIDGNHEFRYVAEDIYEWPKKVRQGGIVSGHDYFTPVQKDICAVTPILHAYVGWFGIDPWYVLGSKRRHAPGEVRERMRSWFFLKA